MRVASHSDPFDPARHDAIRATYGTRRDRQLTANVARARAAGASFVLVQDLRLGVPIVEQHAAFEAAFRSVFGDDVIVNGVARDGSGTELDRDAMLAWEIANGEAEPDS